MRTVIVAFLALLALPAMAAETISSPSGITIRTCDHDAGAICSITWNGKQFVNDQDHGRQCQSASSFDYQGENFNPTEAGASVLTDGENPSPSSSKLLYEAVVDGVLTTKSQMAFWNPVSGVKLSNHLFTKRVKIGFAGIPNVIEYASEFTIPANEQHAFGVFEALTCYMPAVLENFYTVNVNAWYPVRYRAIPIDNGPGEQNKPLMFTTEDAQYAFGIYSPNTPQPGFADAGYGRWNLWGTRKWNNVYRIANPRGTYKFKSYMIIGTASDVIKSMVKLNSYFQNQMAANGQ